MTLPQAIVQFMGVFFLLGVLLEAAVQGQALALCALPDWGQQCLPCLGGGAPARLLWHYGALSAVSDHLLACCGIVRHRQEEAEVMAELLAGAGAYQYDERYQQMREMIRSMDSK